MTPVQAVIFDLDGTLVDSIPGIRHAINEAARPLLPGIQISEQQLRSVIGPPIRRMMQSAFDVQGDLLDQLEAGFRQIYDSIGWQKSIAYPGVLETLTALAQAGIPSFVVTNKPRLPTRQIVEFLHLDTFFVDIVSPDTIEPHFPSKAAAMAHLIATHGLDPVTTWMVGDTSEDGQAALENGVTFVPVSYGYGRPEAPFLSLSSLPELITYLQQSEDTNDQS